jgi:hypothetical protein
VFESVICLTRNRWCFGPAITKDGYRIAFYFHRGCGVCGTIFSLTHFEPSARQIETGDRIQGMIMADRAGLKFVGFIFATVTLAVMLATGMVVKGYADGAYSLEGMSIANR